MNKLMLYVPVNNFLRGLVARSVVSTIADPGVVSLISARPESFRGLILKFFYSHSPPSADSSRAVVSYKQKYVHKVLVNRLV